MASNKIGWVSFYGLWTHFLHHFYVKQRVSTGPGIILLQVLEAYSSYYNIKAKWYGDIGMNTDFDIRPHSEFKPQPGS